jgi:hypothetical protein
MADPDQVFSYVESGSGQNGPDQPTQTEIHHGFQAKTCSYKKKLAAALQKQDKYTLHMFCLSKEGIFYCFVLLQEVSRKNLFNVLNVTILTNFIYFPPFCAIVYTFSFYLVHYILVIV